MIERLNRAQGPVIVVLPGQGFSRPNQEGAPLYVPEGNRAVIAEFQSTLRPEIPLLVPDLHINDPEFADLVAMLYERAATKENHLRMSPLRYEDAGSPG